MIGYLFLLIVVSLAQSEIYSAEKIDDKAVNLIFTNLLRDNVESKVELRNNGRSKVLQIDDSDTGKHALTGDKNEVQRVYARNNHHCVDYSEVCKSLVGTSKIPDCKFVENSVTEKNIPKSCRDIKDNGNNTSGIYEIQPSPSSKPFTVLCDMDTKGGGWTHIQKRFDGSEDFFRVWRDYKHGFGDLNGEFWMGLENIYHMTGFESTELLIELTDRDQNKAYAKYNSFAIGAEKEGYQLSILTGFSGDAGDGLSAHLKAKFSTNDVDQDTNRGNCAAFHFGGWWYTSCHTSCLNGKYINIVLPDEYKFRGINWSGFKGRDYNLAGSRMLIRPYNKLIT